MNPSTNKRPLLIRAAEAIELGAAELKASHTLLGGIWPDDDPVDVKARRDHDEMVALAAECRAAAIDDDRIAITYTGLRALAGYQPRRSKGTANPPPRKP